MINKELFKGKGVFERSLLNLGRSLQEAPFFPVQSGKKLESAQGRSDQIGEIRLLLVCLQRSLHGFLCMRGGIAQMDEGADGIRGKGVLWAAAAD